MCPLSPLLFNIFINELTVYLKSFDLGIDIGGEKACILLYAYDIVLLADTESFAITKPKALLADLATILAVKLKSRNSFRIKPKYV
jgi:hypothetical protein